MIFPVVLTLNLADTPDPTPPSFDRCLFANVSSFGTGRGGGMSVAINGLLMGVLNARPSPFLPNDPAIASVGSTLTLANSRATNTSSASDGGFVSSIGANSFLLVAGVDVTSASSGRRGGKAGVRARSSLYCARFVMVGSCRHFFSGAIFMEAGTVSDSRFEGCASQVCVLIYYCLLVCR